VHARPGTAAHIESPSAGRKYWVRRHAARQAAAKDADGNPTPAPPHHPAGADEAADGRCQRDGHLELWTDTYGTTVSQCTATELCLLRCYRAGGHQQEVPKLKKRQSRFALQTGAGVHAAPEAMTGCQDRGAAVLATSCPVWNLGGGHGHELDVEAFKRWPSDLQLLATSQHSRPPSQRSPPTLGSAQQ
jgi:hypothetical protein